MQMQRTSPQMSAFVQWMERPDDERFWTIKDLYDRCQKSRDNSYSNRATLDDLRVGTFSLGENTIVMHNGGKPVGMFNNFSFRQYCSMIGAPASYLQTLPADIVINCLNETTRQKEKDKKGRLELFLEKYEGIAVPQLKAVTSQQYARIWNSDIAKTLLHIEDKGWKAPPGRPRFFNSPDTRIATASDVVPGSAIRIGDRIGPSGIYGSDRDLFVFMIDPTRTIEVKGQVFYRGFIVENSEVGDRSFKMTFFLYNSICGNHIIYGMKTILSARVVHRGDTRRIEGRFCEAMMGANKLIMLPESFDKDRVERAQNIILGKDDDEVRNTLNKTRLFTIKEITDCLHAKKNFPMDYGMSHNNSLWAVVSGFTRASQTTTRYTSERVDMDKKASQLLEGYL